MVKLLAISFLNYFSRLGQLIETAVHRITKKSIEAAFLEI